MMVEEYLKILADLQVVIATEISEKLFSETDIVDMPKVFSVSTTDDNRRIEAQVILTHTLVKKRGVV